MDLKKNYFDSHLKFLKLVGDTQIAASLSFDIGIKLIDALLHLVEFVFEGFVRDDGRVTHDVLEQGVEAGQFGAVFVDSRLDEVITGRAVNAASLAIMFVLFTAVTATPFDVISAWALTRRVALK